MENIFTNVLNPILMTTIQILAVAAIGFGIRFIRKKTGIQISQEEQRKMEDAAQKAVLAVEEIAANQIKQGLAKWEPDRKRSAAMDQLTAAVPTISHDQAYKLVSWAVAKIPGLGATGVLGQ